MPKPPDPIDNDALRKTLEDFAKEQGIEIVERDTTPAKAETIAEDPTEPVGDLDPRDLLYDGVVPEWVKNARWNEAPGGKRKPGRPVKGQGIRWPEIEHAFIFGTPYEGVDGNTYVAHPGFTELARRFRVSVQSVQGRAKKYQWAERRARVIHRVDEVIEDALITQRVEKHIDARAAASEACDLLLGQFLGAVKEGRIVMTTALDFDRVARLAVRLGGGADKTHEHTHMISLEDIQARRIESAQRHRRLPDQFGAAGRGGEMPVALPLAVDDEEQR